MSLHGCRMCTLGRSNLSELFCCTAGGDALLLSIPLSQSSSCRLRFLPPPDAACIVAQGPYGQISPAPSLPSPLHRQHPSLPSPQVPPLMPRPLPSPLHRQCPSSRHVFCAGRALQQRGALAEQVGCVWLRTISNLKLQTLAQQTAG